MSFQKNWHFLIQLPILIDTEIYNNIVILEYNLQNKEQHIKSLPLPPKKQIFLYNNMQEQIQEFKVYKASHKPTNVNVHHHILNNCVKLQNRLVEQRLDKAVEELLYVCKTQYINGVRGQIFPVQLHKNQQQELNLFLQLLQNELAKKRQDVFSHNRREKMVEESDQHQNVEVVFLQGTQIRDLVLQIYIYLEEHPFYQMVVFIASQITDLSQHNLYCFQKALKNKRFAAVMSTFATFEGEVQSLGHTQYQKYHISLYHPKQLFCEFMYECIAQERIKAYLPEGILTLISDMDYYSISFRQSCRRFRYCLQRWLMLNHKERSWVNFDFLISSIQKIISQKFKFYCGYKNSLQKILKVILSQKQSYTISQKAVSLEIAMNSHVQSASDENQIMSSIRQSLNKYLRGRQSFQIYAEFLVESQDEPCREVRKKKTRSDRLGIDTKKNVTPKNKLENQITKIIKHATQSIRSHAALIKWEDIKYDQRIRPQIPLFIADSYKDQHQTSHLIEDILTEYSTPVAKYLEEWNKEDVGRLIYLLKTFQIAGLVDIVKKQHKPTICIHYFDKASFSGKYA